MVEPESTDLTSTTPYQKSVNNGEGTTNSSEREISVLTELIC